MKQLTITHLYQLLQDIIIPTENKSDSFDVLFTGVSIDSRQVSQNNIFVAIAGNDREKSYIHIKEAITKGAKAIITDDLNVSEPNVPTILVRNTRIAAATLARYFWPQRPKFIMAVTGTAGKTSTTHFVMQIMMRLGIKTATIGSVGTYVNDEIYHAKNQYSLTTPDVITLHKLVAELVETGCEAVVMEASSHGLDQYRLDGLYPVNVAAFTNLQPEHLDYHPDMQSYFAAKKRLFTDLVSKDSTIVLNSDVEEEKVLLATSDLTNAQNITYGTNGLIKLNHLESNMSNIEISITYNNHEYNLVLPLIGDFQAYNVLCAISMVLSTKIAEIDNIIKAAQSIHAVPGRMQIVDCLCKDVTVIVDYAHKIDALEKALLQLNKNKQGKLWLVFGCGGDRDTTKRIPMGKVAAKYADHIIVTDDNPRTEDPALIRKTILQGCPNATEIGDRKEAIYYAFTNLKANDVLLIAGKGHENYQIIGDTKTDFDDVEVVKSWFQNKK